MKLDVLTLAAVIFVVGVLASGLGITDVFETEPAPAVLQQGVANIDAYPAELDR